MTPQIGVIYTRYRMYEDNADPIPGLYCLGQQYKVMEIGSSGFVFCKDMNIPDRGKLGVCSVDEFFDYFREETISENE